MPRSVFQSLLSSPVLVQPEYGNETLSGSPQYLFKRLRSVLNSAARLVFTAPSFDQVTELLRHFTLAPERIEFKLAVLVMYKCLHKTAPPYLS